MLLELALLLISFMHKDNVLVVSTADQGFGFTFNGFRSNNLMTLDGAANFTPNGLIQLTSSSSQQGQAFYHNLINFKKSNHTSKNHTSSPVYSFSTTFVFGIVPDNPPLSAHGLIFVFAPTKTFSKEPPFEYFGVFNDTNNGNVANHIFAVELDTVQNSELGDIDYNHVGIDINGANSSISHQAGYFDDKSGKFQNLALSSGETMQIWVEYSGLKKQINVTLALIKKGKPKKPLLSLYYDLDSVMNEEMYVGFSSTTGARVITSHYVLGWSFMLNGVARELDLSELPKLPRVGHKQKSKFLTIGLPLILTILMILVVFVIVYYVKRNKKFAEVLEDWEHEYGPHRFKYKDLYVATEGFKDKVLLGTGGFGKVYRGVLPTSKIEIAVKKVSHESRQGIREFIAEIVSIGRLRHRNIVPLLGYCRRKSELLLVYEYMPNGSLDKVLYDEVPMFRLSWSLRFRVIKGVAAGLKYLHQEWEKVVIHRDVKASNVLLDSELNGRLGDFGLARLYDHGITDPPTTHVVGTIGYLAPEHTRTGKVTPSTDVYSFGAFLLEVTCGKRPIHVQPASEDIVLVDWVCCCWNEGDIVRAVDPKLEGLYVKEEVELILKLGLLCCNSEPLARPRMEQVVQYLEGYAALPELSSIGISSFGLAFGNDKGFSDIVMSNSSVSVTESILSGGR